MGDCGQRAFSVGLRYAGIGDSVPELPETANLKQLAQHYGLTFVQNKPLANGNNPVLIVYRDGGESTDGEYHAVFCSDQGPFTRWPVHCAVTGWERLAARRNRALEWLLWAIETICLKLITQVQRKEARRR